MKPKTPEFFSGGNKDSRKRKQRDAPPEAPPQVAEKSKPRIIYEVEPRVIHTTAKDFKRVVQLLTGMPSSVSGGAGVANPSPAASIEKTGPSKDKIITGNSGAEYIYDGSNFGLRDFIGGTGVELIRVPGMLSQATPTTELDPYMMGYDIPTTLPLDPYMMEYDINLPPLDPYMMSIPSPSTLFSHSSSSSCHQFNPYSDI